MGDKALFVMRFVGGRHDGQYYSGQAAWNGVTRGLAERLSFKDARSIQGKLKQPAIGHATVLEKA